MADYIQWATAVCGDTQVVQYHDLVVYRRISKECQHDLAVCSDIQSMQYNDLFMYDIQWVLYHDIVYSAISNQCNDLFMNTDIQRKLYHQNIQWYGVFW